MLQLRCRRPTAETGSATLFKTKLPLSTQLSVRARPRSQPIQASSNDSSTVDWNTRGKKRVTEEIVDALKKLGGKCTPEQIQFGLEQLETLLPGPPQFTPNLDTMKASDWALIAMDVSSIANKLIVLNPGMNLSKVLMKRPQILRLDVQVLDKDAVAVKCMLAAAKDPDRLLEEVPDLLAPKVLLSVLTTVKKWWHLERDPVEVLEAEPDLIRRAQDMDQPFEPVYEDENGNFEVPLLNYREKRTDWQAYIDKNYYKQS